MFIIKPIGHLFHSAFAATADVYVAANNNKITASGSVISVASAVAFIATVIFGGREVRLLGVALAIGSWVVGGLTWLHHHEYKVLNQEYQELLSEKKAPSAETIQELADSKQKINNLEERAASLSKEKEDLLRRLNQSEEQSDHRLSDLESTRNHLQNATTESEKLTTQVQNHEKTIANLREKIKIAGEEVDRLNTRISKFKLFEALDVPKSPLRHQTPVSSAQHGEGITGTPKQSPRQGDEGATTPILPKLVFDPEVMNSPASSGGNPLSQSSLT